jgi:hypothetical protein
LIRTIRGFGYQIGGNGTPAGQRARSAASSLVVS